MVRNFTHKQQRCGAMETGNHSNGASPKSQMSRRNIIVISAALCAVMLLGACNGYDINNLFSGGQKNGEQVVEDAKITEEGVVINGIRWSTRNVDMPGAFVENPEDAGMLYQWNRNIGWSTTDPMHNTNGGTTWDGSIASGSEWTSANDPSPSGWRVPTAKEIESLLDKGKVLCEWTTQNGVTGRKFTDKFTGASIFLPAAGSRDHDGPRRNVNIDGNYWSSTQHTSGNAHGMNFVSSNYWLSSNNKNGGQCVRCVAASETASESTSGSAPAQQDVYVVTAGYWDGDENSPQYKKIFTPRLWKNGEVQNLTNKNGGSAHSVFVSGNDVYVAGNQNDNATLWKNGVVQQLSKQAGEANAVFVSGNDVYVAGCEDGFAKLWKNGIAQNLTDGKDWGCAYSVFVSEKDVYVAGVEDGKAKLWKNGVAQNLTAGSSANSVFVSGNDVYVAGDESGVVKLWKNGIPQNLSNKNEDYMFAHSVFVSGNDVYVAGSTEGYRAKLWKNGVEQKLTDKNGSAAYSVFVSGNDVYVAGWENGFATLWKNGVAQKLIDIKSVFATSVFVK